MELVSPCFFFLAFSFNLFPDIYYTLFINCWFCFIFSIAKAGIRLLATLKYWEIQEYTVHHIFQKWVKKFPQKVAFRCEDRVLTFQQVNINFFFVNIHFRLKKIMFRIQNLPNREVKPSWKPNYNLLINKANITLHLRVQRSIYFLFKVRELNK